MNNVEQDEERYKRKLRRDDGVKEIEGELLEWKGAKVSLLRGREWGLWRRADGLEEGCQKGGEGRKGDRTIEIGGKIKGLR